MAIITLKCKNCGDNIHIDDTKQKAFCSSCGVENLIVQDIVNIHNTTTNTTNYHTQQTINKTIIGKEQNEAEDYIRIANEFLLLGEKGRAGENFHKAIDLNPTDYRGWFGLAKLGDDSRDAICNTLDRFNKALKLAPMEHEKSLIKSEREEIYSKLLVYALPYCGANKGYEATKFVHDAISFAIDENIDSIKNNAYRHSGFRQKVLDYKGSFTCPQVEKTITDFQQELKTTTFVIIDGKLIKYNGKDSHTVIPDSVTSIGIDAFADCENLTSILIPASVKEFEESEGLDRINVGGVFCNCSNIKSVEFAKGSRLLKISDGAFKSLGNLTSINIPDSVKTIGTSAFSWCNGLTNITIPESVVNIESFAFSPCQNLTVTWHYNPEASFDEYSFSRCKAMNIIIPDFVTSINGTMFERLNCTIKEIIIPDSVTNVAEGSFSGWFGKGLTVYINKQNSKQWDKKWKKGCKGKIIYR